MDPIKNPFSLEGLLKQRQVHGVLTVAKNVTEPPLRTPQPGSLKGFRMTADFDDPLDDFKDYM